MKVSYHHRIGVLNLRYQLPLQCWMYVACSKSIQSRAGKNKLSNLWCCNPNPFQSSSLQTPHTCSSSPFIVRSTSGTDSLEFPTAMSLHFILSPPCLATYSTSTAFSSLRVKQVHTAKCPVNRGCSICGIWSLAKTFWTRLNKWTGCWVPLPVISLSWCSSLALHHIMQPMKNFNIVLFVNSLTFWCVSLWSKSTINITFTLLWTWCAIFGLRDPRVFHCDDWTFVAGLYQ